MSNLPKWIITNKFPSFFDEANGTVLEQCAILYNEMIKVIEALEKQECDIQEFKCCITNLIENYIKTIDLKVSEIEKDIRERINEIVLEEVVVNLRYNEETESLEIIGGASNG